MASSQADCRKPQVFHHHHVGPLRLRLDGVAGGLDRGHHLLAVHLILAQPREIKEMLYGTIESSNRWIVAKWARRGRHVCPIGQGMTAMMWLGRYAHL